jgi:hypothetical protein
MSDNRTTRAGGTTTTVFCAVITALAANAVACGLQGGTINMPKRVPTVSVYSFGVVACAVPVAVDAGCPKPIPNAIISIHTSGGYAPKTADANGYARFASSLSFSDVKIEAPGFVTVAVGVEPPKIDGKNLSLSLTPVK